MRLLRLRRIWLDLRMGTCSGFPPCCIMWYVTGWKLLYESRFWRWYGLRAVGAGYIRCPLCMISGARVEVRSCTPECGHIEESRRLIRAAEEP